VRIASRDVTYQTIPMDRYRLSWQELLNCKILAVEVAGGGILINVNGTIDSTSLQSHLTGRVITRVDLSFLPARCRRLELIMSRGECRCAGGQGGSIYITPNMKETSPEGLKENQANGLLLDLAPSPLLSSHCRRLYNCVKEQSHEMDNF
jgi:hypothetical protein